MKLSIFKTLFFALSAVMMLGLSGCGTSGDPIDDGIGGEPTKLVEIQISPVNTSVKVNESTQYAATAVFDDGTTKDVTDTSKWTISDTSIATINGVGTATGISVGKVTLAATYSVEGIEKTGTAGLEVLAKTVELVSVQVSPAHSYVLEGESEQFTATAAFNDGTTQDVTSTSTWNISDTSIAVINEKGTATGVTEGNVTLAATYVSGGIEKTGAAKLDVLADDPTFVSLTIEGNDIVLKGGTTQLNAVAKLSDGTTYIVNDKVNWTAIPSTYTTIDTTGVVTGIDTGVALITAIAKSDNSIKAFHDMSVTDIDLQLQSIEIRAIDGATVITSLNVPITTEEYVEAWGVYSDGSTHNINADVVWWSEDQQIASINYFQSSHIYGRDLGSTKVKALFGGVEGSIEVTVVNNGPTLTAITLEINGGIDVTGGTLDPIPAGFKTWVTAYGDYDDGTTRVNINRYVAYSSDKPEVAYVIDAIDSNIRGRSEGSAVITAAWQGVSAAVTAPVIGLNMIEVQEGCGSTETPIIDAGNPLLLSVAESKCINAWGNYSDGEKRRLTTIAFWKSQDQSIASMDILQRNSEVTGVTVAETTVSATVEGVEGTAPVKVSPYIPGTILKNNFVQVDYSSLNIATPPTSATGKADGQFTGGGFYYTASADGTYNAGDLLQATEFEYDATMATVNVFVNVYTRGDANCPTDRVDIGAYDPTVPYTYNTWNEAKTDPALAKCVLRDFINTADKITVGNFYLRFGDSSYVGTDAFTINSYKVN